jgi:hypothetical protein
MVWEVFALGAVAATLRKTELGARIADNVSGAAASTYSTVTSAASYMTGYGGGSAPTPEEEAVAIPSLNVRPQVLPTLRVDTALGTSDGDELVLQPKMGIS